MDQEVAKQRRHRVENRTSSHHLSSRIHHLKIIIYIQHNVHIYTYTEENSHNCVQFYHCLLASRQFSNMASRFCKVCRTEKGEIGWGKYYREIRRCNFVDIYNVGALSKCKFCPCYPVFRVEKTTIRTAAGILDVPSQRFLYTKQNLIMRKSIDKDEKFGKKQKTLLWSCTPSQHTAEPSHNKIRPTFYSTSVRFFHNKSHNFHSEFVDGNDQ